MTKKTVWRQAIELYEAGANWTPYEPQIEIDGVDCYCVGGALAKVITGNAHDMYSDDKYTELNPAYTKFADHVGEKGSVPYQRVYRWNDSLPRETGKDVVLKALSELDAQEANNG